MRQLKDLTVKGMALVKSPANKKHFLLRKSEEPDVFDVEKGGPGSGPHPGGGGLNAGREAYAAKASKADKASGAAKKSGSGDAHKEAAQAHRSALAAASEVRDYQGMKEHRAALALHEDKAKSLLSKSEDIFMEQSEHEQTFKAAPDSVRDAVRAVALAKGADEDATDALECVAHLVHAQKGLTLADLLAAGQAAGLTDVAKAKSKMDMEDEDGDEDEDEDGLEGDDEDDDKPAFLKEKLKKGGPGSGPQKGGGGSSKEESHRSAAKELRGKAETEKDKGNKALSEHYSSRADAHERLADKAAGVKKSIQSADSSANQGGPMAAEKAEVSISKSEYDAVLEQVTKAHERIEKFERDEALRVEKAANQGAYGELNLDHDALARTTLSLRKSAPDDLTALETTLKAANEQVRVAKGAGNSIFRPSSRQGAAASVAKSQGDRFKQMVDEHIAKNAGVTRTQAIAHVAKSAEAIAAYHEAQGEN